jgi:hypothetical protein
MEMGKSPMRAALDGSKEISFTILSMTLSLVAVFIPLLFMPGIVGRLFREFAVTIGVSILVSGFVSLTLTPMLAAKFLKGGEGHEEPKGAPEDGAREEQPVGRLEVLEQRPVPAVVGHVGERMRIRDQRREHREERDDADPAQPEHRAGPPEHALPRVGPEALGAHGAHAAHHVDAGDRGGNGGRRGIRHG